jgi:catechol 2,3-dioxygenase-like lactoylglutathione lyase family enzyme
MSLHHTGITVADLDRSVSFYRDVLGWEVSDKGEREGGYFGEIVGYPDVKVRMAYVWPPGGGHMLEIFEFERPASRVGEPREPRDVGLTHVCILCDDLKAEHERLADRGVEFFSPPILVTHGANAGGWGVYLRDPDGIILELFQPAKPAAGA